MKSQLWKALRIGVLYSESVSWRESPRFLNWVGVNQVKRRERNILPGRENHRHHSHGGADADVLRIKLKKVTGVRRVRRSTVQGKTGRQKRGNSFIWCTCTGNLLWPCWFHRFREITKWGSLFLSRSSLVWPTMDTCTHRPRSDLMSSVL